MRFKFTLSDTTLLPVSAYHLHLNLSIRAFLRDSGTVSAEHPKSATSDYSALVNTTVIVLLAHMAPFGWQKLTY